MRHVDTNSMGASAPRGIAINPACAVSFEETGAPLVVDRGQCPKPTNLWQSFLRGLYARSSLMRSTPFRIGMGFWLLFCVTIGFAGYSFYHSLQQQSLQRIDQGLDARHAVIENVYESDGINGVVEYLKASESGPMQEPVGFYLVNAQGESLFSNIGAIPGVTLDAETLALASDDTQYRFVTRTHGDYMLSVGKSLQPLEDLRSIALHCLLWALAGSVLLAVLAAIWLARYYNCRMFGFRNAMSLVAEGNLAARIPVTPAMDDIDDLAMHINAAVDRLRDNVDSIRQVSTDIAHDLKTPLNRLHIHLDEACGHVNTMPEEQTAGARASLDEAMDEAAHINSTFEALLRVAQIESGARRANFAHFNLAEVMELAYEVYEPVAEESGHTLINRLGAAESLPIEGDRELLLQLVINLVENAIHHCSDGVNIVLDGGVSDGRVWLSVADSGPGIPEESRDKVLRRLYRMERSRTTRGTGLGLSMVKAIGELHGATIELTDNEPGLKVTITFIPLQLDA